MIATVMLNFLATGLQNARQLSVTFHLSYYDSIDLVAITAMIRRRKDSLVRPE